MVTREWEIQGNYGAGWEMVTTETRWLDAKERLAEYRHNDPSTPYRARRVRSTT